MTHLNCWRVHISGGSKETTKIWENVTESQVAGARAKQHGLMGSCCRPMPDSTSHISIFFLCDIYHNYEVRMNNEKHGMSVLNINVTCAWITHRGMISVQLPDIMSGGTPHPVIIPVYC